MQCPAVSGAGMALRPSCCLGLPGRAQASLTQVLFSPRLFLCLILKVNAFPGCGSCCLLSTSKWCLSHALGTVAPDGSPLPYLHPGLAQACPPSSP